MLVASLSAFDPRQTTVLTGNTLRFDKHQRR
jgi:hypothetical protein